MPANIDKSSLIYVFYVSSSTASTLCCLRVIVKYKRANMAFSRAFLYDLVCVRSDIGGVCF